MSSGRRGGRSAWLKGGNGLTPLERHCHMLLRAYPAVYRQERGEEIIGTLLAATPAGRSWPLARDIRLLAMGGLRARAAVNRRLTAAENLSLAVTAGAATYLAYSAANDLMFGVLVVTRREGFARVAAWSPLLAGSLLGLAVALVWVTSRKAVLLAGVMAGAVVVSLAGNWQSASSWPLPELGCLTALALCANRGTRLGRGWLGPVALIVAWLLVAQLMPGVWPLAILVLLEAVGVISVLWVVIDARPAVATAVFLMALWLPLGVASLVPLDIGAEMPLLIVIPAAAVAVWRLRRQSAGAAARHGM